MTGIYERVVAWATAALLAAFAVTMTIAHGITIPLGYGVFTALGGALLLGAVTDIRLSAEREPNMSNQSAQKAGR